MSRYLRRFRAQLEEDTSASGTLSATYFRAALEGLELIGVQPDAILAAANCDRALFEPRFARFPVALEHRLWCAIERHTGDPAIGLSVGRAYARSGRHAIDLYLALHSGTPRRAFANIELLAPLSDDRGHLELREDAALAHARMYRDGGYPRAPGFTDALFASCSALLADRVEGFQVRRIQLARPRPADCAPYERAFGVLPEFSASGDVLSFERRLLDAPLRGSDVHLGAILLESALQLLRDAPRLTPLVAQLHKVLLDRLGRDGASLSNAARALGTSPRTLRRRLARLGTNFQGVLDSLRRDVAEHHLRNTEESVEVISERLGFASTSAFQRAFRRWHATSPTAYRFAQKA